MFPRAVGPITITAKCAIENSRITTRSSRMRASRCGASPALLSLSFNSLKYSFDKAIFRPMCRADQGRDSGSSDLTLAEAEAKLPLGTAGAERNGNGGG